MKKLLTILIICGMTFSAYADKKENENESENESPATENEDPKAPPAPPPNVLDEVENNTSPTDLLKQIEELEDENDALVKDLDTYKVIREVLIKQRQELENELEKLQDDKSDLLDDLDAATHEIKSLVEDRQDLQQGLNHLEDILDRGPGSLFKGWVYSQELKWVYVSPSIVPYAFSQDDGWMLYEYGTHPRRVYYYTTKKWELLDDEHKNEE
jgi:predicted RNase H-like nuclease (RuvC/YqgF family)